MRNTNDDVAILVVSYDGTEYLWDYLFQSFEKFWPDCPYKKYLMTNFKDYSSREVNIIKIGEKNKI